MNKKRVRELSTAIRMSEKLSSEDCFYFGAEYCNLIRKKPDKFNMCGFYLIERPECNNCNTAGCIGGFAMGMYGTGEDFGSYSDPSTEVARILDIPNIVASLLCCPGSLNFEGGYEDITTEQAAQAVDNLFDENVLSGDKHPWHHAMEYGG